MRSDTGPFSIIPNWLIEVVTPSSVCVYLCLARYADNETYRCWPSQKEIAATLNISLSTVKRSIKELQEVGALEVHFRHRDDGSYTSSEYVLLRIDPRLRVEGGGVTGEPRSCHPSTEVVAPVSEQEELYPINYTQLTKPIELDIANEQSSPADDPPTPIRRDLVFDSVCVACGIDQRELTKTQRGPLNRAVKELKDVGATPEMILERSMVFQALWPKIKLTPMALASRWAECTQQNISNLVTPQARDHMLAQLEQQRRYQQLEQKAISQ